MALTPEISLAQDIRFVTCSNPLYITPNFASLWESFQLPPLDEIISSVTPNEIAAHMRRERLGEYFEALLQAALKRGKGVNQLFRSVPVTNGRESKGEFDFIIETAEHLVHLEVAVKYYLCTAATAAESGPDFSNTNKRHFVGPRGVDTLETKINKVLNSQLPLSKSNHGIEAIESLGIRNASRVQGAALIKGYLFYPYTEFGTSIIEQIQSEENRLGVAPEHLSGWWSNSRDFLTQPNTPLNRWIRLQKPTRADLHAIGNTAGRFTNHTSWLAGAIIASSSTPSFSSPAELLSSLGEEFEDTLPILVAKLQKFEETWIEESRGFVVPETWQQAQNNPTTN